MCLNFKFQALVDFKKEKISRQNARLSLANSAYENPSMPYRKILLQTGSANYRPPVERGKAAPKLKVIEEVILEEEEEDEPTSLALERCNSEPTSRGIYPSTFRTESLRQSLSDVSLCNSEMELISSSPTLTSDILSRRTSSNVDTISVATTMSTLVDEATVGSLVVISDNPRAEKVAVCRYVDGQDVDNNSSDDDDLVTDYLTKLRVDADSATASLSPESGRQFGRLSQSSRSSTASSSSRKTVEELDMEDDDAKIPEAAKARNPEEHQDTISDESGYSEDSSPSGKEEHLGMDDRSPNDDPDCLPDNLLVDDCDLSVKGVMISDFSTAERFRYLQRSRRNVQKARADFLQNKVTDFCINI
jgi:hypothetical protein